jgi:hypothetical protein
MKRSSKTSTSLIAWAFYLGGVLLISSASFDLYRDGDLDGLRLAGALLSFVIGAYIHIRRRRARRERESR